MVGIQFHDFSNDQMVARLSTETNQKSAEIIGNKPFFRKLRPQAEFVFGTYLSNGGGKGIRTLGSVSLLKPKNRLDFSCNTSSTRCIGSPDLRCRPLRV